MATTLDTAGRNAHADLEAQRTDAGAGPGYVEVRTGAKPATVAAAASGTLIATVTLNDPAYAAAVAGVAAMDVDPQPSTTAVADGTPGWFRVFSSDGVAKRDGSFAAAGSVTAGETVRFATGSQIEVDETSV